MVKKIDFNRKQKKDDTYETCVLCKSKTNVEKKEYIDDRYAYIEGAGQLCYDCYQEMKTIQKA